MNGVIRTINGLVDDVAIPDIGMFRLEQMDDRSWWLEVSCGQGTDYKQVTFWFGYEKRQIVCRCTQNEMGVKVVDTVNAGPG